MAAALGRSVALADITEMLHEPAARLLPTLEAAIKANVLVSDGARLAFQNGLLWRAIAELAMPSVRLALHDQANAVRAAVRTPVAEVPQSDPATWNSLNDTERAIVELVSQGLTNRQIAHQIFLSPHTVNYHLRKMFRKLGVNSRVDLVRAAAHADAQGWNTT